jgi:hypothetical protein
MIVEDTSVELAPGLFCRFQLQALQAAEGQTRRRKRDQAPDRLGLAIKRDLLERAAAADPAPDAFEGWLVEQIAGAPAAGAVRAMCEQIFLEYRMARLRPELADWLAQGAPSDDAEPVPADPSAPTGSDRPGQGRQERGRADRMPDRSGGGRRPDRWHGTDEAAFACTCHLPQR